MRHGKVAIIYTGGTFGMRPTARGYAPARDLGSLIRARLPELADESMPRYELIEYEHPLESANAAPHDWYDLARRIEEAGDGIDGVVVIHGTDTLAYTASALSFLLADDGPPVLVTGSQIPLCEVRSDAAGNLVSAVQAIATGRLGEVAVCFGRYILRGNRTTKVNATELDAFASPNFPPLAEIGTELRFEDVGRPASDPTLFTGPAPDYEDCRIAVLRLFPGIQDVMIDAIVQAGAAGIVLRCYGVGTAPTDDARFLAALKRACDAGVVITAVSQCQEGSVSLDRYAASSGMVDAGVVSGYDMTTEAAFTKMHALFARGLARGAIVDLMSRNLRGELSAE